MRRPGTLALAMAGALIAVSCGSSGGGGTPTGPSNPPAGGGGGGALPTVTITITGQGGKLAFNPNPATISQGQMVVFKNNDIVAHHVMLDDGTVQTPDIAPGATSAALAMGLNGALTYHCTIHPGMVGGFNVAVAEPPPNCQQAYCFGGG
jgi:plastocyanin